jgi:hypothetical protein
VKEGFAESETKFEGRRFGMEYREGRYGSEQKGGVVGIGMNQS